MGIALEIRRMRHRMGLTRRWWTRPHEAYQPLFVIATCRSGSNLLLSHLRQQPGVKMRGELLYPGVPDGIPREKVPPAKAIRHIRYSLHAERGPIRGCKLMLYQLAHCRLDMESLQRAFPTAKFVVLYRQDIGSQFVSQKLAETTQQFLLYPGQEAKVTRITVCPRELLAYAEHMRASYREVLAHPFLRGRSVLLSYEELVDDPKYWLQAEIGQLLGIAAKDSQATIRKQNSLPLAETVANYAQVAEVLANCRQSHSWPPLERQAA